MAYFVDHEFKKHFGFSALDSQLTYFASESLLKQVQSKFRGNPMFMGKLNGSLLYRRNAQALGCLARHLSRQNGDQPVIAVLFRDCDGTNSTPKDRWEDLLKSLSGERGGFKTLGVHTGVPMMPRPKSEAWLICSVQNDYLHCESLEDLPGNDCSPNGAKKILEKALGFTPNSEQLVDMICSGTIDPERVQMESLSRFRSDFKEACRIKDDEWAASLPSSLSQACAKAYP
jgi:hypothetical protein